MKDNFKGKVEVKAICDTVYLDLYDDDDLSFHAYTPAKARKLATKLMNAASAAEAYAS